MGCRIGWLFCGSNSLVIICQVWTHCFASLFYCKGNVGTFHVGRVYQSLPDCCWSSVRSLAFAQKITNQKHYVKMSKASCCLCMSIQADVYEGRRGYGIQALAVISLFIPKCFGLRPPKVVILEGMRNFGDTQRQKDLSLTSWKLGFPWPLYSKSLVTFTVMAQDILSHAIGCNRWCLAFSCDQG